MKSLVILAGVTLASVVPGSKIPVEPAPKHTVSIALGQCFNWPEHQILWRINEIEKNLYSVKSEK